ncbi:MAG TPA: TPM domain-containing protein [Clostridiales bacterium]|nr:TPM domain-containing protein [Clostridiales bacterium]
MKKYMISTLTLFLALCLSLSAFAANIAPVTDKAGIFTEDEFADLSEKAQDISDEYDLDLVILVIESMGGVSDALDLARQYYNEYYIGRGVERDGMLILLSMKERQYAFYKFGFPEHVFGGYNEDRILDDEFLPLLRQNEYYLAFDAFLDTAKDILEEKGPDGEYDYNDYDSNHGFSDNIADGAEKGIGSFGKKLALVIFAPFLIAGLICGAWLSQMKTTGIAKSAGHYIAAGGLNLVHTEDTLVNTTVSERIIDRGADSSSGSGGFSGGGDSGGGSSSSSGSGRSGGF